MTDAAEAAEIEADSPNAIVVYGIYHTVLFAGEAQYLRAFGAVRIVRNGELCDLPEPEVVGRWGQPELDVEARRFYRALERLDLSGVAYLVIGTHMVGGVGAVLGRWPGVTVVVRAFGDSVSVERALKPRGAAALRAWIDGSRVVLTAGYQAVVRGEGDLLRDAMAVLPVPLRVGMTPYREYVPRDRVTARVMFYCSRIAPDNHRYHYTRVYRAMMENVGHQGFGIPVDVFGWQDASTAVRIPNARCNLDDRELLQALRTYRVLFYVNELPMHLHSLPMEAMAMGMPVVFLNRGLVSALRVPNETGADGELRLGNPGACRDYAEARAKLRRLLDGDQTFAEQIVDANRALLAYVAPKAFVEHARPIFGQRGATP